MNFVKGSSSLPGETESNEHNRPDQLLLARSTGRSTLFLLLLVAGMLFLLYATPSGQLLRHRETLNDLLRAGDFQANITFLLISSLLIMIGTPRLIFFTLGGYAFGFGEGLMWSIGGCLIGSFMTFWVARRVSRRWLAVRLGRRRFIKRIINARPDIATVALIRMLPVSNIAISTALALGQVDNRTFLIGSLIGFLPQGLVAVLVGGGLADENLWAFSWPMGIASLLLCALFLMAARKRSS
jgi:uncharacterized membrane protein YdjX (TVP38/TMEM64 family)